MSKVITMCLAAVFSLFMGLGVIQPKEDSFHFGSEDTAAPYFLPAIQSADIQYKALYGELFGSSTEIAELCDTTAVFGDVGTYTEIGLRMPSWSAAIYEPVDASDGDKVTITTVGTSSITYVLNETMDICAPARGTIQTSHFNCDYGSRMDFEIVLSDGFSYLMEIRDAKCWYCCANKTAPDDGRYTATISDDLKGTTMQAGELLCVGDVGTTVKISQIATS